MEAKREAERQALIKAEYEEVEKARREARLKEAAQEAEPKINIFLSEVNPLVDEGPKKRKYTKKTPSKA